MPRRAIVPDSQTCLQNTETQRQPESRLTPEAIGAAAGTSALAKEGQGNHLSPQLTVRPSHTVGIKTELKTGIYRSTDKNMKWDHPNCCESDVRQSTGTLI